MVSEGKPFRQFAKSIAEIRKPIARNKREGQSAHSARVIATTVIGPANHRHLVTFCVDCLRKAPHGCLNAAVGRGGRNVNEGDLCHLLESASQTVVKRSQGRARIKKQSIGQPFGGKIFRDESANFIGRCCT